MSEPLISIFSTSFPIFFTKFMSIIRVMLFFPCHISVFYHILHGYPRPFTIFFIRVLPFISLYFSYSLPVSLYFAIIIPLVLPHCCHTLSVLPYCARSFSFLLPRFVLIIPGIILNVVHSNPHTLLRVFLLFYSSFYSINKSHPVIF